MTIEELSQAYYLERECKELEDELKMLTEIKSPQFDKVSGGSSNISDPVVNTAERRDEIRRSIEQLKARAESEKANVLEYISTIENNSRIRQIIYYRHYKFYNWAQIAKKLGQSPDCIRMEYRRFFSKK